MPAYRGIEGIYRGTPFYMVGDGFKVSNYFPSGFNFGQRISPFLMLDYQPPTEYAPRDEPYGVGPHPHKGFETVTLALEGAVAHHDSAGNSGVIGPGEVQWMTAGAGLLHKEYHEAEFARRGGVLHNVQLWVNLPAKDKLTPPQYQPIVVEQMGRKELPNGSGEVRVIAGEFQGTAGPASTFSPIHLYDVRLKRGGQVTLALPAGYNTAVLVTKGDVRVNGDRDATNLDLVLLKNQEGEIQIEARSEEAWVLVMSGEPLNEPIAHYGPFVMNTREELIEAVQEFQSGKFGFLE
jgi:quercetin 2,3-dioxygenase